MILIAHRGNLFGPDPSQENHPVHVQHALYEGFHAEIDLWVLSIFDEEEGATKPHLFLGHDNPQHDIEPSFLLQERLWIHCKNPQALDYCIEHAIPNPFFWHDTDDHTLTSQGHVWTYPGKSLTKHSIAVMPETHPFVLHQLQHAVGICSDHVGYGYNYLLEQFTLKDEEEEE